MQWENDSDSACVKHARHAKGGEGRTQAVTWREVGQQRGQVPVMTSCAADY